MRRRTFLVGGLLAAPALAQASNLMALRPWKLEITRKVLPGDFLAGLVSRYDSIDVHHCLIEAPLDFTQAMDEVSVHHCVIGPSSMWGPEPDMDAAFRRWNIPKTTQ